MNNYDFIATIISGVSELRQFDHKHLMAHDYSLPDDFFDWKNIFDYEFNYSDMIITAWNYDKQFLQIDIDTNAFFFNSSNTSPIEISTGEGSVMFYSIEQEKILLKNLNEPGISYDPNEFLTDETNFQGSTLVNIPDAESLQQMLKIAEEMKHNHYKLRTNISFDAWQKLPIDEFFDVCSWRMNQDYDY